VFFWSAPAFGRLHFRAEDNPLGEIAAVVASLRRWSPRAGGGQRLADTVSTLGGLAALAWLAGVLWSVPTVRTDLDTGWQRLSEPARPVLAALVALLVVGGAWLGGPKRRQHRHPGDQPPRRPLVTRLVPWRVRWTTRRLATAVGRAARWVFRAPVRAAGAVRRSQRHPADQNGPGPGRQGLRRLGAVAVTAAASLGAYFAFRTPMPPPGLRPRVLQHPYWWAVTPGLVLIAAYAAWVALRAQRPRRPLLLVIDDLDRCPAERVVKLLETVHTLLRERPDVRFFPRWRRAATLVVLVLGDGRWVRCSFEKVYGDFQALGSEVHGLGADFLQKVFDHVVLVPALSADQVQTYVDDVTELSHWAVTGRRQGSTATRPPAAASPPGHADARRPASATRTGDPERSRAERATRRPEPTTAADDAQRSAQPADRDEAAGADADRIDTSSDAPETRRAEALIASTTPGQVHGAEVRAAIDQAPRQDQQRLAEEVATKAASKEAVAAFSEHLLARYTPLMPANPRLVARVANTFGMLMALGLHVGHHEPGDYVARAAIMFVRFPALVDQLLSDPVPPVVDPAALGAARNGDAAASAGMSWSRPDVQEVLHDEQGQLVDIVRLARCFGRGYPPTQGLARCPAGGPARRRPADRRRRQPASLP
jgi:hypothetical protein